ncbi:MAG: hypothetical protein K5685_04850 [Bacteroidales bacterium]|nr:hypothetical protein [Bacteroidales bacterium]
MEEVKVVDSPYQTKGYFCYLGILILIPLLTIKKENRDEFIKFHLSQGLGLVIFCVLSSILRSVGGGIGVLAGLLSLFGFILIIIGLINVSKKKLAKLPLLGDLFAKIEM